MNDAEVYVEAFRQFGTVSAVLSGLSFASGVSLLTLAAGSDDQNALDSAATWTAGLAIASAGCFVVAAIGWAFLSYNGVGLGQVVTEEALFPRRLFDLNKQAGLTFILGVALFLWSIGQSGHIANRRLGWATTTVAVLASISILYIIVQNFAP